MTVIESIGKIGNGEGLELAIKEKLLGFCDAFCAVTKNNCRVFKTFISLNSLRSSPLLLNEKNTSIPIGSLYRVRDVCKLSDYCVF